jgi:hypothetical protein
MSDFDKRHKANAYKYTKKLEQHYLSFASKIAKIADNPKAKFQKSFKFSNNKQIQELVDKALKEFNSELYNSVVANITEEWLLANTKNDALVKATIKSAEVLNLVSGLRDHNLKALDAFISRKVDGLNLSQRIWNQIDAFKDELEMHLQIGIANGDSANVISRRIRENLLEPEKLFRRVRDKNGNFLLSDNAKAFHPGQGVYRSSFKNARRLVVTETNMAYRNADHLRWQKNPTIVGFEIKLSGSHPAADICDDLKGKYPKSFLYNGWHPHCFCYAVPIMLSEKEFDKYLDSVINNRPFDPAQSENYVSEPNEGFSKWMNDNEDRVKSMVEREKAPYFIQDNQKFIRKYVTELQMM